MELFTGIRTGCVVTIAMPPVQAKSFQDALSSSGLQVQHSRFIDCTSLEQLLQLVFPILSSQPTAFPDLSCCAEAV